MTGAWQATVYGVAESQTQLSESLSSLLDSLLKSRDITLLTKVRIVKAMVFPGEGNGTPLQYSCLENPMDGGVWWAAVHGVAKSRT